jgi:hypothetical protein
MSDNDSKTLMQRERMRLGQVRKSFAAGVEHLASGQPISMEFLAVCVDYIKASMDRLHAQDQRIHDILAPHAKSGDEKAVLNHLDTRLAKSRAALAQLVAARDAFRAAQGKDAAAFKTAIDHFMDVYFNVLLKGQHSTLEMQKKVFTEATWNEVADVTQNSRVTEATLFAEVKKYAPAGADPESFKAGPPVA